MWPFLPRRLRRPARYGIASSLALHGGVCALGIAHWLWLLMTPVASSESASQQVLLIAPPIARPTVAAVVLERLPNPREDHPPAEALDGEEVLAGMVDPRWQELVEPVPEPALEHAGSFVSVELMQVIAEAEQRSSDENLEKLAELSGRLADVSSDDAVDDINAQLRRVLRTEERADRPADEPVEGPFDFATAQLHDVLRKADGRGGFTYTTILVDAAGRKFESPLAAAEGETAYRTMRLIKSNPLLEKVYRGVVMSMLDQALKGAQ